LIVGIGDRCGVYKLLVRDADGIRWFRAAQGDMRVRPEIRAGNWPIIRAVASRVASEGTANHSLKTVDTGPENIGILGRRRPAHPRRDVAPVAKQGPLPPLASG